MDLNLRWRFNEIVCVRSSIWSRVCNCSTVLLVKRDTCVVVIWCYLECRLLRLEGIKYNYLWSGIRHPNNHFCSGSVYRLSGCGLLRSRSHTLCDVWNLGCVESCHAEASPSPPSKSCEGSNDIYVEFLKLNEEIADSAQIWRLTGQSLRKSGKYR